VLALFDFTLAAPEELLLFGRAVSRKADGKLSHYFEPEQFRDLIRPEDGQLADLGKDFYPFYQFG
jgi:hypothetical protein